MKKNRGIVFVPKKHVLIAGKVQGVFFRDYTRRQALHYNLTGWVRNLSNGSVEAILSGDNSNIAKMVDWLRQGSPHAKVDNITSHDIQSDENFLSFDIHESY